MLLPDSILGPHLNCVSYHPPPPKKKNQALIKNLYNAYLKIYICWYKKNYNLPFFISLCCIVRQHIINNRITSVPKFNPTTKENSIRCIFRHHHCFSVQKTYNNTMPFNLLIPPSIFISWSRSFHYFLEKNPQRIKNYPISWASIVFFSEYVTLGTFDNL